MVIYVSSTFSVKEHWCAGLSPACEPEDKHTAASFIRAGGGNRHDR
jgi:hypothetical protein